MRAVRVLAFLGALALLVALATAQEPETTEPEKPDGWVALDNKFDVFVCTNV